MTCVSTFHLEKRIDRTIRTLCTIIEEMIRDQGDVLLSEFELRKELIGCVLGSQVRYEMAIAAIENMEFSGLLEDDRWLGDDEKYFETKVFEVLAGKKKNLLNRGSYRFPRTRSKQIAKIKSILSNFTISERVEEIIDVRLLRKKLVAEIPGFGPKQASLFLRNIGRSFEIAILDVHVIRFMETKGLLPRKGACIGTVSGYEKTEHKLLEYSENIGCSAGYLDLAIWATMKAAKELGL